VRLYGTALPPSPQQERTMIDFAAQRLKMIESQVRTEDVTDRDVVAAMAAVPREKFVPERLSDLAYIDQDLPIAGAGAGDRFLMKPATLARLLQAAALTPAYRVLDVGCGSGYAAAVLAGMVADVVALEEDATLAAAARKQLGTLPNVHLVEGKLEAGHKPGAPYDVILIEGSVEVVPQALLDQLAEGGRLVTVVGYGRAAAATVFTKTEGDIGDRPAFDADVPALPGFRKPKAFVFPL
jgi:protein-L-isoaspartate(D-aspartate) O-methyltransferase